MRQGKGKGTKDAREFQMGYLIKFCMSEENGEKLRRQGPKVKS